MQKTNKLLYLLLFSVLLSTVALPLSAQSPKTWEWVRHIGSKGWDITGGAASNSKNELYVAGTFVDTLRYEKKKYHGAGKTDMYIASFTPKGSFDGAWTFGGKGADQATCLTVDASDNIIFGGSITDTATFGKITLNTSGKNLFVASMNKKGTFSYATAISLIGKATISHIKASKNGYTYASGQFSDTLVAGNTTLVSKGKTDVFVLKITNAGTIDKAFSFGGTGNEVLTSMAVSDSGKVTLAGSFDKTFTAGSLSFSLSSNKANNFITGTDTSFTLSWGQTLKSDEYCKISSLLYSRKDSALYIGGSFSTNLVLTDTTLVSNGLSDGFAGMLTTLGKRIWIRNVGSKKYDYINNLCLDNLGGIVATGSIGDTIQLDTLSIEPSTVGNIAFVAQFNSKGKAIWGDYASGAGRGFGETTLLDNSGNLYIYGSFSKKFEKAGDDITSYGDQDVFFARYYNCPASAAEILGSLEFCPGSGTELKVKSGYTNILWNDSVSSRYYYANTSKKCYVSMYDSKGCLYTDTVQVQEALLPVFTFGRDTSVLVTDSVLLSGPSNMISYKWQDGSHYTTYLCKSAVPEKENCWLTVTDSLGCTFTDTIAVSFYKNGETSRYNNLKLNTWPNPADKTLYWSINVEETTNMKVDITSTSGKVLKTEGIISYEPASDQQTSVENLSPGTYYIRLSSSSGEVIKAQGFVKK